MRAFLLASCFVFGCASDEIPESPDDTAGDDGKADGWGSSAPVVEFIYTIGHDFFHCPSAPGGQIPATWSAAVDANAPYFQALWNTRGEPLLRATSQILGPSFFTTTDRSGRTVAIRNLQATYTVCPGSPGMGVPLILQMSHFIDLDRTGAALPHKSEEFISYAFHEILHHFIDDKAPALLYSGVPKPLPPTPALQYWSSWLDSNAATLPPTVIKGVVLQHLHLLAIMKAAFIKVGRPDLIIMNRNLETTLDTTGSMGVAWTIVDLPGATEALVAEIQELSR